MSQVDVGKITESLKKVGVEITQEVTYLLQDLALSPENPARVVAQERIKELHAEAVLKKAGVEITQEVIDDIKALSLPAGNPIHVAAHEKLTALQAEAEAKSKLKATATQSMAQDAGVLKENAVVNQPPTVELLISPPKKQEIASSDDVSNRHGTLFDDDGSKEYEGQLKDGKPHGQGIFFYEDGGKYEGLFKDGKFNDQGITFRADGSKIYEGQWKDDEFNGQGISFYDDGSKYEGLFKDNKCNGKGIHFRADGSKLYEGQFKDGNYNGKGISFNEDGSKFYEGAFKDGQFSGQGIFFLDDGSKYEGQFKDDKFNGKGTLFNPDGSKAYEGQFKDGNYNGQGITFWENGSKSYEGQFKDNKFNGKGTMFKENGGYKFYEGLLKDGNPNGQGALYGPDGSKFYEGQFEDGKPNGQGGMLNLDGSKLLDGQFNKAQDAGTRIKGDPAAQVLMQGAFILLFATVIPFLLYQHQLLGLNGSSFFGFLTISALILRTSFLQTKGIETMWLDFEPDDMTSFIGSIRYLFRSGCFAITTNLWFILLAIICGFAIFMIWFLLMFVTIFTSYGSPDLFTESATLYIFLGITLLAWTLTVIADLQGQQREQTSFIMNIVFAVLTAIGIGLIIKGLFDSFNSKK